MKKKLKLAYNDFLPIKKSKYQDLKKLLNYVTLPQNVTFYSDNYLKFKGTETSDSNQNSYCTWKGKCLKKCL